MKPASATPRDTSGNAAAFTLIELLTVIVIIGILCAIIIPTTVKVRQNARTVQCLSNLRQIGIAAMTYSGENKDMLLLRGAQAGTDGYNPNFPWPEGHPERTKTWNQKLAPYMGMDQKSARSRFNCPEANPKPTTEHETTYGISCFLDRGPVNGRVVNLSKPIILVVDSWVDNYDGIWPWNSYSSKPNNQKQLHRHNGGTRQNVVLTDGSARTLTGKQAGIFGGATSIAPNLWMVPEDTKRPQYITLNPSTPSDFP
ncbi:prepilin-type N-terminal cleavage/methylation domain-containing protein [Opitutaceae bacterium TAV1]|nr:prepilin-type N-terminal cleavage/methylation domain-containing protein [Opitutaceae bacterium TAV1]